MTNFISDIFYSPDNRGEINIFDNKVIIPKLDNIDIIQQSLIYQKIPIYFLPTILHEYTHFNCFNSPVGEAILHCYLKAKKLAKQIQEEKFFGKEYQDLHWQCFDAYVRYQSVLELLRPLAEGLAVFAEFDECLGKSECQSKTMSLLLEYFIAKDKDFIDTIRDQVNNLDAKTKLELVANLFLSEQRLCDDPFTNLIFQSLEKETLNQRKKILYEESTYSFKNDNSLNADYLVGYWLVKSLYTSSFMEDTRRSNLSDPSLFSTYLIQFFYYDFELVFFLLNSEIEEDEINKEKTLETVAKIKNHIFSRFSHFLKITDNELTNKFEKWIQSDRSIFSNSTDPLEMMNIAVDPEQFLKIEFPATAIDRGLWQMGTMLFVSKNIELIYGDQKDIEILANRRFFCIGSFECKIEVPDASNSHFD